MFVAVTQQAALYLILQCAHGHLNAVQRSEGFEEMLSYAAITAAALGRDAESLNMPAAQLALHTANQLQHLAIILLVVTKATPDCQ